jgi:hypothetical protein
MHFSLELLDLVYILKKLCLLDHMGTVHISSRGSINGHTLGCTTKRFGSVTRSDIYVCSEYRQVAGACKCGNEPSGSIKCGEFLD